MSGRSGVNQYNCESLRDRRIRIARAIRVEKKPVGIVSIAESTRINPKRVADIVRSMVSTDECMEVWDASQRGGSHYPKFSITEKGREVARLKLEEEGGKPGGFDDSGLWEIIQAMPIRSMEIQEDV